MTGPGIWTRITPTDPRWGSVNISSPQWVQVKPSVTANAGYADTVNQRLYFNDDFPPLFFDDASNAVPVFSDSGEQDTL